MTTLEQWQEVPVRVATLLPQAMQLREAYLKIAANTGDIAVTTATWDTVDDVLVLYRPSTKSVTIKNASVVVRSREEKPDWDREILIKAAAIPVVGQVFDFGHKMLGGSTPLANALVSGAMMGGLGYGAGALAENLFPERYMQRGKLRRNLALLGVGAGGLLGLNNAYAVSKQRPDIGFWKSWVTPSNTSTQQPGPPRPGPAGLQKQSFQQFQPPSLFAPTVSVPQFNQAAWQDVQRGMYNGGSQFTPPAYAAAATGLMSGISTAQRSPIIRPVDVIRGIASAGVGLATANVAGRALSAMAGLTPAGQEKLQDMGLWGGMMHAIVPSMFR